MRKLVNGQMKTLLFVITLTLLSITMKANDAYRNYLLTRVYTPIHPRSNSLQQKEDINNLSIPRYKIPIGNVFCRMEDKLTKATKVWICVGVK